jgi:hypothetical protein
MSPTRWRDVRERLRAQAPARPPAEAGVFWAEFKARARMTPQTAPEPASRWRALAPRWGVGLAAAAAVLLAVVFLPHGAALGNRIRSLEVVASHTGVIILNDTASKGTILWVTGLDPGSGNGG